MKNLFFAFLTVSVFTLTSCSKEEASSFGPITFTDITKTSLKINWEQDLSEFERYEIYRDSKLIKSIDDVNVKSYTDSELTPDTSYDYFVKAIIDDKRFIKVNGTVKTLK